MLHTSRVLCAVGAFLVAACPADEVRPGSPGMSQQQDAATPEGGPSAGPSPTEAGTSEAAADAGDRPAEAGPADAGDRDLRLYPYENGRSWTYSTTQIYNGTTTLGTITSTVTGKGNVDGREAWTVVSSTVTSAGSSNVTNYNEVKGDDVWGRSANGTTWIPILRAPIQEGGTWTWDCNATCRATLRRAGSQTVAAGTFNDCWRLDSTVDGRPSAGDSYNIVCRGVGGVLTVMNLNNGFQYRAELTQKSF